MERTPRDCAEGGRYYEYVIDGIKDMIARGGLMASLRAKKAEA